MREKGETRRAHLGRWLLKILALLLNPRLLLCFGLAWLVTNGWAYIFLGLGILSGIKWMSAVAGAYLAFLWIPVIQEKILTIMIAILLLRRFFPNDEKTLGMLREWQERAKAKWKNRKQKKKGGLSNEEKEDHGGS